MELTTIDTSSKNLYNVIDLAMLEKISYKTNLGKNLKNTLRKFDKEILLGEVSEVIIYLASYAENIKLENRVKSFQSASLKYDRYFPTGQVEKVFNDLLGIRTEISSYEILDEITLPKYFKMADMRNGKAKDDGYRGVPLYYQKDHYHYPIEIQLVTPKDKQFNEWLHLYVYKYVTDCSIGIELRNLYDNGVIVSKDDFLKEVNKNELLSSKEI